MAAVIVTRTWSAGGGGGDLVPPDQEARSPGAHAVPRMTLFAAGTRLCCCNRIVRCQAVPTAWGERRREEAYGCRMPYVQW